MENLVYIYNQGSVPIPNCIHPSTAVGPTHQAVISEPNTASQPPISSTWNSNPPHGEYQTATGPIASTRPFNAVSTDIPAKIIYSS